ncbi:hypothetical protein [Insolitispirillum peregrinum]|uniref:hypothetical protein n=1 Tax=Insolitispirillum peregrinum TaxID=80876 RepID=UPI00361F9AEF
MIMIEDLSKDELAQVARQLLACEDIARLFTEEELLEVRAAVLSDREYHAFGEHRRASEVLEALSRRPNVTPQTLKRAMNKEKRLFAEWQRLREQRAAVRNALNAAYGGR